jgi:soluble lytic murein transglycosylase-like protein
MPDNSILADYQGTGASAVTAAQDHLPPGADSSRTMAKTDLGRVKVLKERFNAVAEKYDLPAALLAAIASRESRCGNVLVDGWGDHHNAFGVMQVDIGTVPTPAGQPDPRSLEHIDEAAHILAGYLGTMKDRFSDQPEARQLQAAVAAYNRGPAGIASPDTADAHTTGHDYSNDVWARACFFALGW